MTILLKTIRALLQKCIDDIDTGNCYPTDEEAIEMIDALKKYTRKDMPMSKYQCCEYLNISRTTFNNLVNDGKLPEGQKVQGFKEKFWYKKDLDKYIKECKRK